MSEKPKFVRPLTPVGEALWAHVHKPKPEYIDPKGKFKTKSRFQVEIVFDPKDPAWAPWVEEVRKKLVALPQQFKDVEDDQGKPIKIKVPKQSPIHRELDKDDKETGRLVAIFATGIAYPPGVFDKFNRVIPPETLIGNGSKIRVSYNENTFDAFGGGINFYLRAIQVTELVAYKSQTAEGYGFTGETAPADEESPSQGELEESPF